jgi:serine/threonine protein kinase
MVFVPRAGGFNILDFGLAWRVAPAGATVLASTRLASATEPGVVLGTVGYMAPEQVRGQPADHRADIFSLGAVVYEMLSGRRAFHGETAADTISALLKEPPPARDRIAVGGAGDAAPFHPVARRRR